MLAPVVIRVIISKEKQVGKQIVLIKCLITLQEVIHGEMYSNYSY